MNVSEVMASTISCCGPHDDLEAVALLMMDNDCGSIPVTNEQGQPIGMITDRDIAIAAAARHKALWQLTAQDFLTTRPVSACSIDDDIRTALSIMQRDRVRRLAVINGNGEVRGMLSLDDIVAFAERGVRGLGSPDLSYDDAIMTMKVLCKHH